MPTTITTQLKTGAVGVMPTDTIYGLVASAFHPAAVERIYQLKHRNSDKPMIILVGSLTDLGRLQVQTNQATIKTLNQYWPGPTSVVLPCPAEELQYLHRGTKTLALRLPDKPDLLKLLQSTGPLIATSANPESLPPAQSIAQAKKYFGNAVDFYVDEGEHKSAPSTLIKLEQGKIVILRP